MLIDLDFSSPEILEKYRSGFLRQYQKDVFYVNDEGWECFGFNTDHPIVSNAFRRVAKGIFESGGFGASSFLENVLNANSYSLMINLYGVADNWQQVLKKKKEFVKSKEKFVMTFSEIKQSDQPEKDGWRWNKWGMYIGDKNPRYEYLYDEKGIESVIIFHFHIIP